MAQRIGENLWRLEIPLPNSPLRTLNSYLLTGERNLLIDTGFRLPACRAAMEAQLADAGADLSRTDIFLTHLHSDHTGLSTLLHRPGCRVFIGAVDGPRMQVYHHGEAVWRRAQEEYIREGFSREEMETLWTTNPARLLGPEPLERYDLLADGDVLEYGGRRLRCLWTPGHTPGHLCLLDETRGDFFSGDHILFHITPNICRWEETPDSLGDYLRSLRAVRDLPVRRVLPGHRADTGDLRARADELAEHHRRRLDSALRTVLAQPGLTAYDIAGGMRWQIRCRSWADFPLTQKFFAVGEALAHLDYLAARGKVSSACSGGRNRWYAGDIRPLPAIEHKGEV